MASASSTAPRAWGNRPSSPAPLRWPTPSMTRWAPGRTPSLSPLSGYYKDSVASRSKELSMATATKVWTEKYLEMTHGKTRYWEAGTGYPTILIHGAGWTSACESWTLNIGPLSERLHVYAIDCLNWGLGDVLDQEFSFA